MAAAPYYTHKALADMDAAAAAAAPSLDEGDCKEAVAAAEAAVRKRHAEESAPMDDLDAQVATEEKEKAKAYFLVLKQLDKSVRIPRDVFYHMHMLRDIAETCESATCPQDAQFTLRELDDDGKEIPNEEKYPWVAVLAAVEYADWFEHNKAVRKDSEAGKAWKEPKPWEAIENKEAREHLKRMLEEVKEPDDPIYIPHVQIPMPVVDDMATMVKNGVLNQWEVDFCERLAAADNFSAWSHDGKGPQILLDVMEVAYFLGFKPLMFLMGARLSFMTKDLSEQQVVALMRVKWDDYLRMKAEVEAKQKKELEEEEAEEAKAAGK